MTFYIAREGSKLWRRVYMETSIELQLLAEKWKILLAGLIFQYIHGLAARGVHYLHRPGPTLQDIGFFILPELGQDRGYVSETVFTFVFVSFALWSFHPFIFQSKKFYTVLLWCRVLTFLVVSTSNPLIFNLSFWKYMRHRELPFLTGDTISHFYILACQVLRIITFYSTQLPGPNYHCREGSKLARLPRPDSVLEVLLINFPRGVIYGCGDLIFSSHMIFALVFVLTYQKYGTRRCIKQLAWLIVIILSLLIIASRKHYTVDVVVAWYTVNLVVFFVDKKLPELPDRTIGATSPLLPLTAKERENRSKEEHNKLLNGNSGDNYDWRQRTQVNGKLQEDGNNAHADAQMNGS